MEGTAHTDKAQSACQASKIKLKDTTRIQQRAIANSDQNHQSHVHKETALLKLEAAIVRPHDLQMILT